MQYLQRWGVAALSLLVALVTWVSLSVFQPAWVKTSQELSTDLAWRVLSKSQDERRVLLVDIDERSLAARVRRALVTDLPWTPAAARGMRHDFHPTTDGWRVSEVNSDVPGGYNEAATFTAMIAEYFPGFSLTCDPRAALADALALQARDLPRVALLAAPGYTDDLQVVAGLAAALRERGCETLIARPEQLLWRDRRAHILGGTEPPPVGVIFRFYQGEWMTRVAGENWQSLFRGGLTPVCNPAAAVLSESKRLPLLWDELAVPVPTWSRLLPPVRAPQPA